MACILATFRAIIKQHYTRLADLIVDEALVDSELAIFLILHVSCHPRHLVFQIVK